MIKEKKVRTLKAEARESLLGHLTYAVIGILTYIAVYLFLTYTIRDITLTSTAITICLTLFTTFIIDIFLNLLEIGLCSQFMKFRFNQPVKHFEILIAFTSLGDRAVKVCAYFALLNSLLMLPSVLVSNLLYTDSAWRDLIIIALTGLAGSVAVLYVRIRYTPAAFLLLDYPSLSARKILRLSSKLMHGNKRRLLSMWLSFVPLLFLGLLSLGIGYLWVFSYMLACKTAFYCDLVLNNYQTQ